MNDKVDASDATVSLSPTSSHLRLSSSASITIKDDDILATTTGLYVTGKGSPNTTVLDASWNAVTGADGYYVEWKTSAQSYDSSRRNTVSGGSTLTHTITGLTAGTTYTVRVIAYKSGYDDSGPSAEDTGVPGKVDYDSGQRQPHRDRQPGATERHSP